MGMKSFHLRPLGQVIAASWAWETAQFSFAEINPPAPPAFTVLPSITGLPEVGETLTGVDGTVSFGTITARQWLRDGAPISGATGATYFLVVADDGADITFRNIATGDGGTVNGDSLAVGPIAEGLPGGLELGSESLKFQPGNLMVANQTSVIKQSTTGLTDILTSDDSFLFGQFYYDADRDIVNNAFALMGSGVGTNAGRFQIFLVPEAFNSGAAALRRRFVIRIRRTIGTSYEVQSGLFPRVSGWYDLWVRRSTGGVNRLDIWSRATGALAADGAATALTQSLFGLNAFNQTHFYIGDAQDVAAEATTATARGINTGTVLGWEGGIAFVGWGNAAVSDADCEAIALGADPVTRIGASAFTFARRFLDTGATSLAPVAGTSDTSASSTVIGTFLPGGTPGRQHPTDFITLDPVPDYKGFGVDPVTLEAIVPFAGNCGGVAYSGSITAAVLPDYRYRRECRFFSGQVQGRFIEEDGTPVGPWQTVAATAATGVTQGRSFTEQSRSAAAIQVLGNGQSQMTIWSTNSALANTIAEPAVAIARQERGTSNTAAIGFQTRPDYGNLRVSDGLTSLAQTVRAAYFAQTGNQAAVSVVLNALDGSSALDMIDDWSRTSGGVVLDTEDLLAYAGSDVTVDLWQWFTTHIGEAGFFGTNILDAVYNGTGPNATANTLPDIRRADAALVISPATRQTPTSTGPLDTDPNAASIGALRAAQRAWAAANGATIGPEITDMRLDTSQGPHQLPSSARGNLRIGIRLGEAINRALGFSASVDPTIGAPRFVAGKAAFTLTATLPNAGSTLRVDDTATFASNVQGFEVSTNGGSTYSRSGFTVTFSGTTVTVTKSSGDWTGVSAGQLLVRYAYGSPFGFGLSVEGSELFRGGLYDGTALEGGLGLPVTPMAPTVVAEP